MPSPAYTLSEQQRAQAEAEEKCHQDVLSKPLPNDDRLYCNRTWDGWGCWDDTLAGTRAFIQCPTHMEGFDGDRMAYKDCTDDGRWWEHPVTNHTWANYTNCVNMKDLETDKRVIYIFIAGYSISIFFLLVALIIFFSFRQLQCDRVTLHKNLFASYILNGLAWILYYTLAAMNGNVLGRNPVWCQALHVITQYFVACNFFWMFCEGFYLHTVIVVAFTSGKKLLVGCFIIGWWMPVCTTVIYTACRLIKRDELVKCWMGESEWQWIVLGPIVVTIALNFAFLINIVRVLVTKLRAVNSPDSNQTRKAVRATLILIPLLGLQYILLPFRPENNPQLLEIYLHVSAFFTAFQGLFVALIFCFFNGEVITILKRKWDQHRMMSGKSAGRGFYSHTTVTTTAADNVVTTGGNRSPVLGQEGRLSNAGIGGGSRYNRPMPTKVRAEYLSLEQGSPDWNSAV